MDHRRTVRPSEDSADPQEAVRSSGDSETLGGQYAPSENNADLQGIVKGGSAAYEGGEHARISFSQLSLGPSTIADIHLINVYRVNAKMRASKEMHMEVRCYLLTSPPHQEHGQRSRSCSLR